MTVRTSFDTLAVGELFLAEPLVNVIILGEKQKAFARCPGVDEQSPALDVFALYAEWDGGRERQPPHLAFANLATDRDAAVQAFLGEYGLLQEPGAHARRSPEQVADEAGQRVPDGDWLAIDLDEFRALQEEFAVVARLWDAIAGGRAGDIKRELLRFADPQTIPASFATLRRSIWGALMPSRLQPSEAVFRQRVRAQVGAAKPAALLKVGAKIIETRLNERLSRVRPSIAFLGAKPQPTWLCFDLLESFYVMLRLDICGRRRLVSCQGCGKLFGELKANVTFCSSACSGRARYARWYEAKGRKELPDRRARK